MKTKLIYLILIGVAITSVLIGTVYATTLSGTAISTGTNVEGRTTIYILKVVPSTPSTIAHIQFQFPAAFANLLGAARVYNIQNIGPGHFSQVNSTTISYDVITPASIPAGTQISLVTGGIINTSTPNPNYTVTFATLDSSNSTLETGTFGISIINVLPDITDTGGNVGIGTTSPTSTLSVVNSSATQLTGTAKSLAFLVSAGSLSSTAGSDLALGSIGGTTANAESLGVHLYRTSNGTDWTTTALGLGMDVDNTVRAGAAIWLNSNGNVGIGTNTPQNTLDVNGIIQTEGNRIINVGTPTATTDVQVANHLGLLGSLVKGICGNGKILQYQSSNSTWVCATPLSAAITSINGDTTAAQKILRESGNTTVTNSTGQVKIGIGPNVVITGGAAQTISKQMTFSSNLNVGGNLASTASSGTFKITAPSGVSICIGTGC
ncbi:MAG: hypothetical protein WBF38_05605 [Nitrosotalea sp.]